MILTALDRGTAYRMHTPKWAVAPTSGAGAARNGGRLNRPGIPGLYLCLDSATAVKEYQQVSTLLPPGTVVTYRVSAAPVVDFREGFKSPRWQAFDCDWRHLWFSEHVDPPSWVLADEAIAAGAKGILFHSRLSPGGVNLVLYTEVLAAGEGIAVFDPAGDLPKDQQSWS